MSAWLLSIVGVVSLGVLIEIIMPEGEHGKYVKGIFSLIVVFVIVSPFPKIFSGENIPDLSTDEIRQTEMDEDAYDAILLGYREKLQADFDEALREGGIENLDYVIGYDERYVLSVTSLTLSGTDRLTAEQRENIETIIRGYFGNIDINEV